MISTETKLKVAEFLERNEKINAIKFLMDTNKIRLAEAQTLVASIEKEFFPDRKSFRFSLDPSVLAGWIFTAVGIICLAISIILFLNDRKASENSFAISGTVVDLRYSNGSAAPVIRFTQNGTDQTVQGSTWSKPPGYAIGEKVELLVTHDGAGKVIINNFSERYFLMTFLGGFAILFGVIGSLVLIFLRN